MTLLHGDIPDCSHNISRFHTTRTPLVACEACRAEPKFIHAQHFSHVYSRHLNYFPRPHSGYSARWQLPVHLPHCTHSRTVSMCSLPKTSPPYSIISSKSSPMSITSPFFSAFSPSTLNNFPFFSSHALPSHPHYLSSFIFLTHIRFPVSSSTRQHLNLFNTSGKRL